MILLRLISKYKDIGSPRDEVYKLKSKKTPH